MRVVFFMGAGFSVPFGLPVMNTFFRSARDSRALSSDEKRFLEHAQRFAHMGVRLIHIGRNNLEDILSFLIMAEQVGIVPKEIADIANGTKPYEFLQILVREICKFIDHRKLRSKTSDFARLVGIDGNGAHGHDLSFVTTNYDLSIEVMLQQLKVRAKLPGDLESTSGRSLEIDNSYSLYDINSPRMLCKLHGSINWCASEACDTRICIEQRLQNYFIPTESESGFTWPAILTSDLNTRDNPVPLLVAPTLFKHQTDRRFLPVWAKAAELLSHADKVIFVGYSFPESDTYMRYFLGATLVNNVNVESIDVIDPNAEKIVDRLRQDDRYGAHFKELLRPFNGVWENSKVYQGIS